MSPLPRNHRKHSLKATVARYESEALRFGFWFPRPWCPLLRQTFEVVEDAADIRLIGIELSAMPSRLPWGRNASYRNGGWMVPAGGPECAITGRSTPVRAVGCGRFTRRKIPAGSCGGTCMTAYAELCVTSNFTFLTGFPTRGTGAARRRAGAVGAGHNPPRLHGRGIARLPKRRPTGSALTRQSGLHAPLRRSMPSAVSTSAMSMWKEPNG